jgi:hypothetical protein
VRCLSRRLFLCCDSNLESRFNGGAVRVDFEVWVNYKHTNYLKRLSLSLAGVDVYVSATLAQPSCMQLTIRACQPEWRPSPRMLRCTHERHPLRRQSHTWRSDRAASLRAQPLQTPHTCGVHAVRTCAQSFTCSANVGMEWNVSCESCFLDSFEALDRAGAWATRAYNKTIDWPRRHVPECQSTSKGARAMCDRA